MNNNKNFNERWGMLESCQNLDACEEILSNKVQGIHLLGEIDLTDEDVDILVNLIRQIISVYHPNEIDYFKKHIPNSFAFFLVAMGKLYDKERGYWPIIEEKIDLPSANLGGVSILVQSGSCHQKNALSG